MIVVDNGSRELPEAICASRGARLLTEAEPGPGPARNRGVTASSGEILAFIDADCLADPGWLAAAEGVMADPSATILGGDVRIALADPARPTMTEAYESLYAYRMDRYIAREGFTGTGNLVVRRNVLLDVGPFAGIGVAEDRDWGHRRRRRGIVSVSCPRCASITQHGKTSQSFVQNGTASPPMTMLWRVHNQAAWCAMP